MTWRKVKPGFWWCKGVGSATKIKSGWMASNSSYQDMLIAPIVGPFKTAKEAIAAYEKERHRVRAE